MARILIIDDQDEFRGMLRQMLERDEHKVVEAVNGLEGIKSYVSKASDVVITDITMPHKDGLETIHDLCARFPDVKIIAISGGGQRFPSYALSKAEEAGAKHTLTKPFSREDLRSALDELLKGSFS